MALQRAALICMLIFVFLEDVVQSGSMLPAEGYNGRRKRETDEDDDYDSFYPYVGSYAGSGFAAAGAGFPYFGYPSRSMFNPFWPLSGFSRFPFIIDWHNGPNVCKQTEYADEPDAFQKLVGGVEDQPYTFGQSSQESCTEKNNVKICRGNKMEDGQMKMYITKYECCKGFERSYRRPGCVAAGSQSEGGSAVNGNRDMNDESKYDYSQKLDKKEKY